MTSKIIDLYDKEILNANYDLDYHHNLQIKDFLTKFKIQSSDVLNLKKDQQDKFVFFYTFFLLKDFSSRKNHIFMKKINSLMKDQDFRSNNENKNDLIFIIKALICASISNNFYNKLLSSVFSPFGNSNYSVKKVLKKILPKITSIDTKEDALLILNFIESLIDYMIDSGITESRLSVLRILQPTLGSVLSFIKKHIKEDNKLKLEKLFFANQQKDNKKKMILCKLYDEIFNFYEDISFIETNQDSFLDFSFYYLSLNDKRINLQIESSKKFLELRKTILKIFLIQYEKLLKTSITESNQQQMIFFLKHAFREYADFKIKFNSDIFREWVVKNIFTNSSFNIEKYCFSNHNLRYLNFIFLIFTKNNSEYNQECLKFFNKNIKYFNEIIIYFKSNNYKIFFSNLIDLYQTKESDLLKKDILETIIDFINNSNLEIKHIKSFEPYILKVINKEALSNPFMKHVFEKNFEKMANLFVGIQNKEILTNLFFLFNDLDNFDKKSFLNSFLLINFKLDKEIYNKIIKEEKYNSITILNVLKQESFIYANHKILFSKEINIEYYNHIQTLLKLNCLFSYDLANLDIIIANKNFLYSSSLKSEVIEAIYNDYYTLIKNDNSFLLKHLGALIAGHKNTPNEILLNLSSLYPKIVQKNKAYKGAAKTILTYFNN